MKYLLATLIFFNFVLCAQVLKPQKMYDHINIFQNFSLPLKQYIKQLKQIYPYDLNNDEMTFYLENSLYSHFKIKLEKDHGGYTLNFLSENSETITIRYEFSASKDYTLLEIMNTEFLDDLKHQSYKVSIYPKYLTFESDYSNNLRETQYIFGLDATTVNLTEYFQDNFYESTLFYKCANCGGEILRANFTERNEMYFLGSTARSVNDREFFSQANRFYLSPLLSALARIINTQVDNEVWPEDQ